MWKEKALLYRVLGRLRGEPKAIVARCDQNGERDISMEAIIINVRSAEQLGYVEVAKK